MVAEYRLVVDFADPDHLPAMQNIGNSGRPDSPHYRDHFADWLAGRYHVVSLRVRTSSVTSKALSVSSEHSQFRSHCRREDDRL